MSRRVAVIGFHGVGETPPGAMQGAIVKLLGQNQAYGYFTKHELHIPVTGDMFGAATGTPPAEAQSPLAGFSGVFKAELVPDGRAPDLDFTKTLLDHGQVSPATYNTAMWSAERAASAEAAATRVDVYELYWSDLSHPAMSSGLGIFAQFIQLLIHLASLGRLTVETVLAGFAPLPVEQPRGWRLFNWLNKSFYWLLSMPIVIGNLCLALLAALFLSEASIAALPGHELVFWRGLMSGAVTFAVAAALGLWWLGPPPRLATPARTACVAGSIALAILIGVSVATRDIPFAPVVIVLLLAAGDWLMRGYRRMRPGALGMWRGLAATIAAALVVDALGRSAGHISAGAGAEHWWLAPVLDVAHLLFIVLLGFWLAYCLVLIALSALGGWLHQRTRSGEMRQITGRAIRTCWLAALLPAPLFLAFVLGGFMVLRDSFSGLLGRLALPPLSDQIITIPAKAHWVYPTVYSTVGTWLVDAGGIAFLTYSAVILTGCLLVCAALSPSVLSELFPLARSLRRWGDEKGRSLGFWLDGAFGTMQIIAVGVFILFPFIVVIGTSLAVQGMGPTLWQHMPAALKDAAGGLSRVPLLAAAAHGLGAASHFMNKLVQPAMPPLQAALNAAGGKAVIATSGFLAGSKALAGTASGLWKSFSNLFNRLRVVIDIAQDADNWLRERPQGDTVRFQAFARFASLLRHIETHVDGHVQGHKFGHYDSIVILGFSQGCVVAADYLRYVTACAPAARPHAPVKLLTLGCPLRQVYRQRFPVLYRWVEPAAPDGVADLLGVRYWRNLYGSGDYIGRDLWTAEGTRAGEACVGPQAHTRYFDEAAAAVGDALNALI